MPVLFAAQRAAASRFLKADATATWAKRLAPALVFLVALGPRLSLLEEHPLDAFLVSNMAFYDARAAHLLSGERSVHDAFTPVGYPAMVALLWALAGKGYALIGVVQALLGAATCSLGGALGTRLTRSSWAGLLVGLGLAFYTPLIAYTGFLLTETVFAFQVTAAAWLLARSLDRPRLLTTALAGLCLGTGAAVRPNLVLAFPLLAGLALLLWRRRAWAGAWASAWKQPLLALAFAAPVLALAVASQSQASGKLTGVATNGGVNFYLGHCECRAVRFPKGTGVGEVSGAQNRKRFTEVVTVDTAADDEGYFYRASLGLFRARPLAFLGRGFVNVGDGLVLTPLGEWPAHPYYPGLMEWVDELRAFGVGFAWLAIVPALGHLGWLAARRRLDPLRVLLLTFVASMLATLFLYLGDARMRVPFDPLILALAVGAWIEGARGGWRLVARARTRRVG